MPENKAQQHANEQNALEAAKTIALLQKELEREKKEKNEFFEERMKLSSLVTNYIGRPDLGLTVQVKILLSMDEKRKKDNAQLAEENAMLLQQTTKEGCTGCCDG